MALLDVTPVAELCPFSSAVLLGILLLVAAALLLGIHLAWSAYASDIAAFYSEAAANAGEGTSPGGIGGGPASPKNDAKTARPS